MTFWRRRMTRKTCLVSSILIWRTILILYSERYINLINNPDATESIGLRHTIQCWYEQGGTASILSNLLLHMNWFMMEVQSSSSISGLARKGLCFWYKGGRDLCCSNGATTEVSRYAAQNICTQRIYGAQEVLGSWLLVHGESGRLYLGLAMVWKLQVGIHLDCKDWELCMIVCSGNFTGGALYLPDLDLCLA